MKKSEFIRRHGKEAYAKHLIQNKNWKTINTESKKEHKREQTRKSGRYYKRYLKYKQSGIQGGKNKIRHKHWRIWNRYKHIIAPESQLHHQWILGTADYIGLALVEADAHMHGYINVIQILEGEITLLTEKAICDFKR